MQAGIENRRPAPRANIELLATIQSIESDGSMSAKCFGNILELGVDAMVLESHREQAAGTALLLNVVFPGQRPRSNPVVTFRCVVRSVRDRNRLHYDVAIEEMNDITRKSLVDYLSAPRAPRANRGTVG